MTLMTNLDWCDIKHFKPSEFRFNGKDVSNKMDYHFINRLDQFREMVGKPIKILSSFRDNNPKSQHINGIAVDIQIVGLDVMDMFLAAERSDFFKGIGVYPNWNNAGIHIDMRNKEARWATWDKSDVKNKKYVALDSAFWEKYYREKQNESN